MLFWKKNSKFTFWNEMYDTGILLELNFETVKMSEKLTIENVVHLKKYICKECWK